MHAQHGELAAACDVNCRTLSVQCRVIYVATAVEVDWWAQRIVEDPRIEATALDIEWRVTFNTGETQVNVHPPYSGSTVIISAVHYLQVQAGPVQNDRTSLSCSLHMTWWHVVGRHGNQQPSLQGRRRGRRPWCSWPTGGRRRRRASRPAPASCCTWRPLDSRRSCASCSSLFGC